MNFRVQKYLLTLFCILVSGCQAERVSTHRTDREMVSYFQLHQADFNKLLAMFKADEGLQYFSKGHTRPEDASSIGVTAERRKQYQEMFTALGIDGIGDVSDSEQKDEVWFFTSIQGPRESTFKHYDVVLHPTRGVVENLDIGSSKSKPYRHIEGNWYLALDDAD